MAVPLSYNLRNVRVRLRVTLLAVLGIALVVAVFAVLMSMSEGFAAALRSTGRSDNAMIVQRGSNSELSSQVRLDHRKTILDDVRLARGPDGRVLASWEWVVVLALPRRSDGRRTNVTLRAVPPQAFEVRGGIRVTAGRRFTPGLDEVIVGRRILGRVRGLELGGTLRYRAAQDRRTVRLRRRRLRERGLGRLRHPGRLFPARHGLELPGRPDEGPGADPRARPVDAGPTGDDA